MWVPTKRTERGTSAADAEVDKDLVHVTDVAVERLHLGTGIRGARCGEP